MNQDSLFVAQVLSSWQDAKLPFVILRNYEGLPEVIGNDIDILIAVEAYESAVEKIEEAALATGFTLFNRVVGSGITALFYRNASGQVHFDLATSPRWRFLPILSAEAILEERCERELYNIPHPVHEASLKLLYRLLLHGYVKEVFKTNIQTTFEAEPERVKAVIAPYFSSDLAQTLVTNVQRGEWAAVEATTSGLRKALIRGYFKRSPLETLRLAAGYSGQFAKRFKHAPGLFIAIVGPSDESARLAAGLAERLEGIFVDYTHADELFWSEAASSLALVKNLAKGRLKVLRKGLVIATGSDNLETARGHLADGLKRFILEPDILFHIDLGAENSAHHHPEPSPEPSAEQHQAYSEGLGRKRVIRLTRAQDFEKLLDDAEEHVFAFLLERARRG